MAQHDVVAEQVRSLMNTRRRERRLPPAERSVLVVEDEENQQKALVRAFTTAGMNVRAVSNGIEAFEMLRQQDYRAILCDLRMPGQSGLTFFDLLEEMLPHLAGRVIFMSAYAHDPQIREYLERTGQPFIEKPYDLRQLVETVNGTIEKPFHV